MPSDLPPHGGVVVLDYGFGRKAAASAAAAAAATRRAPSEQRRRGGNANANGGSASFAAAAFLREESAVQDAPAQVRGNPREFACWTFDESIVFGEPTFA